MSKKKPQRIETIEQALAKIESLVLATHSLVIKVEEFENSNGVQRQLSKPVQFAASLLMTKILFRQFWETLPADKEGCEQMAISNVHALGEALHETFLKFGFDSKKLAKELYGIQDELEEK